MATRSVVHGPFAHPHGPVGRLAGRVMAVENRRRNALVVAKLNPIPGERVLELGCGPGIGLREVARTPGVFACGIDASLEMVAMARSQFEDPLQAPAVLQAAAEALPYPDGLFQAAFAVRSVRTWRDPPAALAEVHRCLAYGGRLLVAERTPADPAEWEARSSELEVHLEDAGFESVLAEIGAGRRPLVLCWGWKA